MTVFLEKKALRVEFDGVTLGEILGEKEMRSGRVFQAPTGNALAVAFKARNSFTLGGGEVTVDYDGRPLSSPSTASGHEKSAVAAMAFVAVLTTAVGLLSALGVVEIYTPNIA